MTTLAIFAIGATDAWVAALMAVLLLGCLGVLCVGCSTQRQALPWHALLWPALAYGALVLSQIGFRWTSYPGASWTGLEQLAGPAAALYLALFAFRSPRMVRRLARAAWWVTLVISIEAIFQHFLSPGYIYWLRDATYATPTGPYVYHNHFAGCMDLLLPLAVAAVFLPERSGRVNPQKRWLLALSPALGLAAVVISRSRGGMLCLFGEAVLALIVYWLMGRLRWKTVLGGAAALVAVAFIANWGPIWRRFLTLQNGDLSSMERWHLMQSCLAIWRTSPWHGSGFNTFAVIYPQYQVMDFGKTVVHAHNEYVQMLAEMGVFGAVVVAAFVVLLFLGYRRGPAHGTSRLVRRAALIGVIGFLAHSVIDFQFHNPANALLFFLIAGAVAARVEQDRRVRASSGTVVRLRRRPLADNRQEARSAARH
ncbi:MAG: O-antigen ligase family protein [Terriglobales bacterium]